MPSGIHQLELSIPIRNTWDFVSDMNNWAPLVPGYIEHKVLNERQSTWKFKGDTGIVQKTVCLKIDITKWEEPTKITFKLTGINENFVGDGYFEAKVLNDRMTKMTGYLNVNARGMIGPMINSILKTFIPKTTKTFTEKVANRIMEVETVEVS